jgi:hypothetical protein
MTGGRLILASMLEAATQGDWSTVDRLKDIAQDPAEVGRLIAHAADRVSHSAEGGPAAPATETFSESDDDQPDPPDAPVAGPDARAAIRLTQAAMNEGRAVLESITTDAVARRLNGSTGDLFNSGELARLADAIASTNATAELLGRYRIREQIESLSPQRFARFDSGANPERVKPLPPKEALRYFQRLMPSLSDIPNFNERHQRTSFTLAARTGDVILRQIQASINNALASGETGTPAVQELLDRAGVSTRNPQYADMVFRTNAIDSLNAGFDAERQAPDVVEEFPVWQYLIIDDSRTGEDHRPKGGKFYPSSATFAEVRGERPFSCRCSLRAVSRREWARRQSQGATVESNW